MLRAQLIGLELAAGGAWRSRLGRPRSRWTGRRGERSSRSPGERTGSAAETSAVRLLSNRWTNLKGRIQRHVIAGGLADLDRHLEDLRRSLSRRHSQACSITWPDGCHPIVDLLDEDKPRARSVAGDHLGSQREGLGGRCSGGGRAANRAPSGGHVRPAHQVPDRHRSGKRGDLRRL